MTITALVVHSCIIMAIEADDTRLRKAPRKVQRLPAWSRLFGKRRLLVWSLLENPRMID